MYPRLTAVGLNARGSAADGGAVSPSSRALHQARFTPRGGLRGGALAIRALGAVQGLACIPVEREHRAAVVVRVVVSFGAHFFEGVRGVNAVGETSMPDRGVVLTQRRGPFPRERRDVRVQRRGSTRHPRRSAHRAHPARQEPPTPRQVQARLGLRVVLI